jgi:hypothetical protein
MSLRPPPAPRLSTLQQWMQAVMTHPRGVAAGIASPAAKAQIDLTAAELDTVVRPSRAQTSAERLAIYHAAYYARLLECLREEYSVLAAALGEELFDEFAVGFLQEHPSRSYTLAELGKSFPEYLAATRPPIVDQEAIATEPPDDWPEFMIALAELERAINQVFDGPGSEATHSPEAGGVDPGSIDRAALARLSPEGWPSIRFGCCPSLKLLALTHPVNDYFSAIRRGDKEPPIPAASPAWLALLRRDYKVRRYVLSEAQYRLLSSLQSGATVSQALQVALEAGLAQASVSDASRSLATLSDDAIAATVQNWFAFWTAEGFFIHAVAPNGAGALRVP